MNEVGGDPALPAAVGREFHARMQRARAAVPHGLTATATHDTKRGEDARTRMLALSELPELWATAGRGDGKASTRASSIMDGRRRPSPGHEYMLYQA